MTAIRGCRDPRTALAAARALTGPAPADMQFWHVRAAAALAGLLHIADLAGADMATVRQWADGTARLPDTTADPVLSAAAGEVCRGGITAASIRMTVLGALIPGGQR